MSSAHFQPPLGRHLASYVPDNVFILSGQVFTRPTGTIPSYKSDICWHRSSPLSTYLSPPVPFEFLRDTLLCQAAIDVSSSYDALLELFECIASFLKRFHVYTTKIPLSSLMSEIIVKILVEVLSVLALATKQIKQGRFSM
jgi:hypothetical protein